MKLRVFLLPSALGDEAGNGRQGRVACDESNRRHQAEPDVALVPADGEPPVFIKLNDFIGGDEFLLPDVLFLAYDRERVIVEVEDEFDDIPRHERCFALQAQPIVWFALPHADCAVLDMKDAVGHAHVLIIQNAFLGNQPDVPMLLFMLLRGPNALDLQDGLVLAVAEAAVAIHELIG